MFAARKTQGMISRMSYMTQSPEGAELNRTYQGDLAFHDWYRFVLSYPPHLVRNYVASFRLNRGSVVLDPFCGTGTTLVESRKLGVASVGIEANPVVQFAASTKLAWDVGPDELLCHARQTLERAREIMLFTAETETLYRFNELQSQIIIRDSISPLPLHRTLVLLEAIDSDRDSPFWKFERLALMKHAVHSFSNLRFGPEVGVRRQKKLDVEVNDVWFAAVESMCDDLRNRSRRAEVSAHVHLADSRNIGELLLPGSIDAVVTSPPYPNEKDYSRTTRLESVLLGYLSERKDLRKHKSAMLVSNTRNAYKGDEDAKYVENNERVQSLAAAIERSRTELGKTSGFEKLYGTVVKLYFGGMAKHFRDLAPALKSGARLAYVVGDQASFFRVHIRTGEILAEIAEMQGYTVERTDLFRTRFSTVSQQYLREEALILRWKH